MDDYLEHHGILGQKWGKRSGPPYPLTEQKHMSVTNTASSEQRFAALSRGGGKAASLHTKNSRQRNAGQKLINKVTNMDVADMSIKSKKDLVTAKKYVATYMLGKNEVDTILKENTKMSRIQTSKEMEKYPFYATYKKHDVEMYEGIYGKSLKRRARIDAEATGDEAKIAEAKAMKVYRMEMTNTKGLRVPSEEHAGKITAKLLDNPEFKNGLKISIEDSKSWMIRPSQQMLLKKAEKIIDKHPDTTLSDKEKKDLYRALNLTLVNHHNAEEIQTQNMFYEALKKKGYGAIVDTNDQEYSSYHAKRPMIVFDTSNVKADKLHDLDDKRVNRLATRYYTEIAIKESIEQTFGTPIKYIRDYY